jgi:hypothetical protein
MRIELPPSQSVVVLIVDKDCVLSVEREGEPPICIDAHGPVILKVTAQVMKLPTRNFHLFRRNRDIQESELFVEFDGVGWPYAGLGAREEKLLDPLVPKTPNHSISVLRNATLHN